MYLPSIWLGYDPHEAAAFGVARHSITRRSNLPIRIHGVMLERLVLSGLYTRPTTIKDGQLFDEISEHPMSTEFAISRFLVPHLAGVGWALFADSDILARRNIAELFHMTTRPEYRNKAVIVVKHDHEPTETIKMRGQTQSAYLRKNWSSVMLFNCEHKACKALTPEVVNRETGRFLHQFRWVADEDIGELGAEWNWLQGHSDPTIDPKIVHFTDGTPNIPGRDGSGRGLVDYAGEWHLEHRLWVG